MAKIVPLQLTAHQALKAIREVTQDSSRVYFSDHARRRMRQRKITTLQILKCLQKGTLAEGPAQSASGAWEMRVQCFIAGHYLHVPVALETDSQGNFIIVITAYWE